MQKLLVVGFIALSVAAVFSLVLFLSQDVETVGAEISQIQAEADAALRTIDASDQALEAIIATAPNPSLDIEITLPEVALPSPPRVGSVNDPGGFLGVNADIADANRAAEQQWRAAQVELNERLSEAEARLMRQINAAESRLRTELAASQQQVTGVFANIQNVQRTLQELFERLANVRVPDSQSFLLVWLPIAVSICSAFGTFWYAHKQYGLDVKRFNSESPRLEADPQSIEVANDTSNGAGMTKPTPPGQGSS